MVVMGSSDERASQIAESIYRELCETNAPIFNMSLIDAEIFKMSLNAYITLKISFANALANLCEEIPGANVDAITKALGADRRISPHYLKGGLSFGGTCFPRDTKAFVALARAHGTDASLIEAVEVVNRSQDRHLFDLVHGEVKRAPERAVSVLGLAFKPNTDVIVESPAIKLIASLLDMQIRIAVYDPLAMANTRTVFGDRIVYSHSADECLARSPVCVVMNPDPAFKGMEAMCLTHRQTTVIDCWRILDRSKLDSSVRYVSWGMGPSRQARAEVRGETFKEVATRP